MSSNIKNRLTLLRKFLQSKKLQAFVIPSSDIHQSEYPADRWKCREWISGFTGSAGTMVVTLNKAGLWTDSRYFLQAEKELEGTGIILFKEKLFETPSISDWLTSELTEGNIVGIDGDIYSARDAIRLKNMLDTKHIGLDTTYEPFSHIWDNRPPIPKNSAYQLSENITGKSISDKFAAINAELKKKGATGLFVASLDTTAWIFNMRGNDVEYNPVFVSFAYISERESVLFIDPDKINPEIADNLRKEGVTIAHYKQVGIYLNRLNGETICLQGDKVPYSLYNVVKRNNQIFDCISPADWLKSMKNETELSGFRQAMVKDGVALVKFLRWLEKAVPKGKVTENTISEKLVEFRSQQLGFVGESFGTIAGYQENGAIVHYHADKNSCKKINSEGFLLIDSGAQYFDGTTDITRTIALGKLTPEMIQDYTSVLKGHIALASIAFPKGTRGSQIDVLARQFLWKSGANYLHGTGHGIGHFLNVHEGPQSIRMEENPVKLQAGMVLSNEPGIYRDKKYGIRIENLMAVESAFTTECGEFLKFETLTLCPIDLNGIDQSLLSLEEKKWLNNYHHKVFEQITPFLDSEEANWLKEKTYEI